MALTIFERAQLRRISNLEERINDIFTAQSQFVTLLQTQELLATISTEINALKEVVYSLESRVAILENLPDIDG